MDERERIERTERALKALVARRIDDSLEILARKLDGWRRGECSALEAHNAALRHVARTGILSTRVLRLEADGPDALLRDAVEAGLVAPEEFRELTGRAVADVPAPASLDEEIGDPGVDRPNKRNMLQMMIREGAVLVHLDSRLEGVDVPAHLKNDPRLVLRIGHGLTPPIADLEVGAEGVGATLTFGGVPHRCAVPWGAVWALVGPDGKGVVFPADVPTEVAAELKDDGHSSTQACPAKRRDHLKLV